MRRCVTRVLRLRVTDASDQQPMPISSTAPRTEVLYDFSDDEDDFFAAESNQVHLIYCYDFSVYVIARTRSFDK